MWKQDKAFFFTSRVQQQEAGYWEATQMAKMKFVKKPKFKNTFTETYCKRTEERNKFEFCTMETNNKLNEGKQVMV